MKALTTIFSVLFMTQFAIPQQQWAPQNSGVSNYLFDIHFTDQFNGWASGVTGLILFTNDGGVTWTPQDPPPNNAYYGLTFSDSQTGWACGFGGKIIHTANGGETWTDQNSGLDTDIYDIFFINQNTGWAVGGDNGTFPSLIKHREIIYTNNGGQNWSSQLSMTDESLLKAVHFVDENTGAAVGESGIILFTTNGGQTWEEKMSDNSYHFSSVFMTNDLSAYVVGLYLGLPHVPVIFKTEDGGTTWTNHTFGEDEALSDIYFTDMDHGWAVGGTDEAAIIMYTNDAGENWNYEDAGTDRSLSCVHFSDETHGWAAGFLGVIVSTNITTGLDVERESTDLKVFPNPASDVLHINFSEFNDHSSSLRLINSSGQIVYQLEGITQSSSTLSINTEALPPGLYSLVVEQFTGVSTKKVLISK